MRHQQYRDNLLERLRTWRVANVDALIADARKELRKTLRDGDVDLLFDNWLNNNWDRIDVVEVGPHSHTAIVRGRKEANSPAERADAKRKRDAIVSRINGTVKASLFDSFAAIIWDTILPNGTALRDAKGRDLTHATGWYAQLAKLLKPTEKLINRFSTKDLFNLSQRPM